MNVLSWITDLLDADDSVDQDIQKSETFEIIDPDVVGEEPEKKVQSFTVSVVNGESGEEATVVAYWTKSLQKVYEKSVPTSDASDKFTDISTKASQIKESIEAGSLPEAEEASKKLLMDLKMDAAPVTAKKKPIKALDVEKIGLLYNTEFGPRFEFKDSYLSRLLRPIDITSSPSSVFKGSSPDLIYATHAQNHIGKDNYVAQWFKKVLTADGMIEDVALIERNSGRKTLFFIVPECNKERFEKVCRILTPQPEDVGLAYKEGKLTRVSGDVTMMHFENPSDAADYQQQTTEGEAPPPAEVGPAGAPVAVGAPGEGVPSLPPELEEAGRQLAEEGGPGGVKGPAQVKMDEMEQAMYSGNTVAMKKLAKDKKSKPLSKYDHAGDHTRDGKTDYSLSKWDKQTPPEKPESNYSVLKLRYITDLAAYEIDLPHGTRTNLSKDVAKAYLLNEGYNHDDAIKHLNDAKKGEVALRKDASLKKKANPEVIELLKSPSRRGVFSQIVKNSLELGEIEKNDSDEYECALAEVDRSDDSECWKTFAMVCEKVYNKAQQNGKESNDGSKKEVEREEAGAR